MTVREMLEEQLKRKRERLTAMSAAAPEIEAEAVGNAVYFMASSLVRRAVEVVVEAEAEALADAVAKAVAKALPETIEVTVGYDGDIDDCLDEAVVWYLPVEAKDIAEDLAQWTNEHVPGIVETLIKSAADDIASRKNES